MMGEQELDSQVKAIADQLAEQFNLAISIAVDENQSFAQGESIFRDAISVLNYYNCTEVAVEQLNNFAKAAFFRKEYGKALYYAAEAWNRSECRNSKVGADLHAMAFRLLELVMVESPETMCGVGFEDLQDILTPEDYCQALRNIYCDAKKVKTAEDRQFLAGILRKITLETMRQGIRREKLGDFPAAMQLLKTALPFLNPKRAAVITEEIKKLEESSYEQRAAAEHI